MNDNEKKFKEFVGNIKLDDTPDPEHRDKLEQKLLCVMAKQPRQLKIWRIIMKSQITKLATAAVIIVSVVLSVTILNNSTSTAWAIEQSIAAVSQYKAVIAEGLDSERTWRENGSVEQRPFKSWAVANEEQTMIEKYRHEVDGIPIITTNGQKTWRYDRQTNTVRVENRPYIASECWFGGSFLEQLKEARDKWILTKWEVAYGKDLSTGKERAFLTFSMPEGPPSPRSLRFEFDVESKLLVSFKQWENPNWEGPANLVVEKITYYENLPDGLFEFEIPEGATVIEE
jgi:outer membrane lipoprotein-sorting protein